MRYKILLFIYTVNIQILLGQMPKDNNYFLSSHLWLSLPLKGEAIFEPAKFQMKNKGFITEGLAIEQYVWEEGVGSYKYTMGIETHIGAYINNERAGKWLFFHDSTLFGQVSYRNGLAHGEATYFIVNKFYEVVNDTITGGYLAQANREVQDSVIIRVQYENGEINGKYQLENPYRDTLLIFVCKSNRIVELKKQVDFPASEVGETPPFEEYWNQYEIVTNKEVIDSNKRLYNLNRKK